MTQKLLASVLALSLAFTGFAAVPARADNDAAKLLAGIATVFIIGKAIQNKKDRDARATSNANNYTYNDRWNNNQGKNYYEQPRRDQRRDKWKDQRRNHRAKILPSRCLDRTWARGKWFHYYGARCLQRFGKARSYPSECRREVRTDRGWRNVYGAHCLGRQGYRVARNDG